MSSPGNTASMGKMAKRAVQPASSTETVPVVKHCNKGSCGENGVCSYACKCGSCSYTPQTNYNGYCVSSGTYYMYLPSSDDCQNTTIFQLNCSNVVFANSKSTGSEELDALLLRYMSWYWSIIHNNNTMQVTSTYPSSINVKKTMTLNIWNAQIVLQDGEESGTNCYIYPDSKILCDDYSSYYYPTQPYTTTTTSSTVCSQCYWQTLD